MKQTEQEIRLFQGTVSAILGETGEKRSAFANFDLNAFTIMRLTWLAEKIGWIPSYSYENTDTWMPSFLMRILVQPIVNPT